jgi:hypothetical protein
LPGLDGRSATERRFRDLVNAFIADMGGLDRCSEIRLGLPRRLAATTVQAEMLEAHMVNGEAIDIATLCTLASTTVRLSQRLGLERRTRNVIAGSPRPQRSCTAESNGAGCLIPNRAVTGRDLQAGPCSAAIQTRTRLWRESNQSLSAPGIPAGKTFAKARDRGGIFGGTSRLHARETALSRVCGCKATES